MDRFQHSFIPKKIPLATEREPHVGIVFNLFALVAVIIFAISLVFATYVFIHKNILIKRLEKMSKDLAEQKSALEVNFMKEAFVLDRRLNAVKELLSGHLAPTEIFSLLEANTISSVRFTDFSLSVGGTGNIDLKAKGEARNFSAVALQSDVFGDNKYFINPIFTDFQLKENGNVTFSLITSIKKDLVDYRKLKGVSTSSAIGNDVVIPDSSPSDAEANLPSMNE
jgi:hypothetical protein